MNGGIQLLVFCGVFLAMFVLTAVLSYAIPLMMLEGANPLNLDLKNPAELRVSKILQLVSQIFFFGLPALIFAFLAHKSPKTFLRWKAPSKKMHWVYGIAIIISAIPFISSLEHFNQMIPLPEMFEAMEKLAAETTEAFLASDATKDIITNIFIFVIFAAVFEELLFRGVLQNLLVDNLFNKKNIKKRNVITAFLLEVGLLNERLVNWFRNQNVAKGIILTAFLFSAIHFQMAGFFPRFFAGLILGLAYHYSGSLLVPILMHAINNGLSIYLFHLEKHGKFDDAVFYEHPQVLMGLGFGLLCFIFLYYMRKIKTPYTVVAIDHDPTNTNIFTQR